MTNTPTPRQREIAQIGSAIQRGNFNAQTLRRFRELVADEAKPQIDAALQRAMPQIAARAQAVQGIRNEQRRIVERVSRDVMARYRRGEFNKR